MAKPALKGGSGVVAIDRHLCPSTKIHGHSRDGEAVASKEIIRRRPQSSSRDRRERAGRHCSRRSYRECFANREWTSGAFLTKNNCQLLGRWPQRVAQCASYPAVTWRNGKDLHNQSACNTVVIQNQILAVPLFQGPLFT